VTPSESTQDESIPTDEAVVTEVLTGDIARFELIMRRHNQRLFRMARAILCDDAEAEDAVQQAYISAYTHLGDFNGESAFSTWLTRITRNEALTRIRRRARRSESPLDIANEDVHTDEGSNRSPEESVALGELTHVVERAIDALPEIYRVVFVMREVEGLDTADTAACLEVSEEVVKVRLHRARNHLQRALLDDVDARTPHAFVFLGERCNRIVAYVLSHLTP
jgi:RNA polymerase sigma-70 factor (ECF subfamily)